MTNTKFAFAAGLVLAAVIAAAPAQAATRQVDIGMQTFADRCVDQGGLFAASNATLTCETASVRVDCSFVDSAAAECSWPGIDNRVAVNRLIGMAQAESLHEHLVTPKKGGVKLLELPLKWK